MNPIHAEGLSCTSLQGQHCSYMSGVCYMRKPIGVKFSFTLGTSCIGQVVSADACLVDAGAPHTVFIVNRPDVSFNGLHKF